MAQQRGRAYNRAQQERAKGRAHELIANVRLLRGDNPSNEWEVSADEAARLKQIYSVDRCAHTPRAYRGEHRQEQQAALNEREQLCDENAA
jgi:hypothetical protein